MELHIARGDPGYRGRYIGVRLRAAFDMLDRHLGKATQPIEHSGALTILEQLVGASMDPPDGDSGKD